MNTTIKARGIELTPALRSYIEKRIEPLEKIIPEEALHSIVVSVEVEQTTKHHKQGNIFSAEINISGGGLDLHSVSEEDDIYAAIDDAKDDIAREITSGKKKNKTLFKKGALAVKNMMKGIKMPKWRRR